LWAQLHTRIREGLVRLGVSENFHEDMRLLQGNAFGGSTCSTWQIRDKTLCQDHNMGKELYLVVAGGSLTLNMKTNYSLSTPFFP
jgi:hypothetical protein